MQKGFWSEKSVIKNTYPYLSKDLDCDVTVIGGGICGAITAYFLAKEGFKVAVVEKNIIGYKNTSLSSAAITDFMDELYIKSEKDLTDNMKYKIMQLKKKSNSLLDEILVDINAIEYLKKIDYNLVNTRLFQKSNMRSEVELREKLGEKAEFATEISGINIKQGARLIDPYDFSSRVFEYISRFPNVYIFENTVVKNLSSDFESIQVTTQNDFKINSNFLVFTTCLDFLGIGTLSYIEKYRRFSVVLDTNVQKKFCMKILNDIPIYIRSDEKGKCIVSGIDTKFITKMEDKKYIKMLENENARKLKSLFDKIFPNSKSEISTCFSANIYKTRDNLPVISEIEEIPNTYINIGSGSSSIAQMLIGADYIKDAIKGYYKKEMNLFKLHRK